MGDRLWQTARWWPSPWLSFPRCGNGLSNPLDSGLRRNDGGGCDQAFVGMTVGAAVKNLPGMARGLSGWRPACFLPIVIPAKAGIQEGGGTVVNG